jgi:hypothetical protein
VPGQCPAVQLTIHFYISEGHCSIAQERFAVRRAEFVAQDRGCLSLAPHFLLGIPRLNLHGDVQAVLP